MTIPLYWAHTKSPPLNAIQFHNRIDNRHQTIGANASLERLKCCYIPFVPSKPLIFFTKLHIHI